VQRLEGLLSEYVREHLDGNLSAAITVVNDRSLIIVVELDLVMGDEAQVRAAYDSLRQMVEHFGKLGFAEYRAHLDIMDIASEQLSFNDHAYRRFVEKIKDAVDPRGILSPGRHGVWPAAYRGGKAPGGR
jgi:4-cresol dehydrogenase (hydroxylating)